jgi:predicted transcriptional regulator
MKKSVKVEEQNRNIFAISKSIFENNIGSVAIIDNYKNKNPIEIVIEMDIIKTLSPLQPIQLQLPIREYMNHAMITLSSIASIADSMKLMSERKIMVIIMVEEGDMMEGYRTQHLWRIDE